MRKNPNPRTGSSWELHQAAMAGDVLKLNELLAAGVDPDARDRDGRTPLMEAATTGKLDVVRTLLDNKAAIDARDREGWTALHFAAQEHHVAVAQLLVTRGATVDSVDSHGNSPLWRAVFNSRDRGEMIGLLLSAGADRHLKNAHGISSVDLAKTIANYDVARFFI